MTSCLLWVHSALAVGTIAEKFEEMGFAVVVFALLLASFHKSSGSYTQTHPEEV